MASRYHDLGSKQSSDRPRRRHPLGPRSKTMIEETSTSRYRGSGGEESPGLGRRYGSARYYRKNTDLNKSFDDSTVSPSYSKGISPRSSVSTSGKYTSSVQTTRPASSSLHYGRSSSFSRENAAPKYSVPKSSSKGPLYLDFTKRESSGKEKIGTTTGRDSPVLSRLQTSSYKTRYPSPSHEESRVKSPDRTKTYSPTLYQKERGRLTPSPDITKGSSSRSSSFSSKDSSTVSSRKSSTSSTGRDRVAYLGSYSGRTSPDDATAQNISLLSQHITRTFHPDGRRGSDGTLPERAPFLRSYSLRSDYTSRYVQHQIRERKNSCPVHMTLHKQASLPEKKDIPSVVEEKDERSRKGSWLRSRKKPTESSEKGKRSDSESPSAKERKLSLSSKLSSSNESNTETAQAPVKRKFSVPSKYISSKEKLSRESSGGSSEILDATEIGRARKKYSLPGKLSFRKRSTSIERTAASSKSEPGSPVRYFEEIRPGRSSRSGSLSSDTEKIVGSVMRRFKFWDKKERRSPRSRSISPEGRQRDDEQTERLLGRITASDTTKPSEVRKNEEVPDPRTTFEETKEPASKVSEEEKVERKDSITSLSVVSKKASSAKDDTEKSTDKKERLTREQRRARYRRGAVGDVKINGRSCWGLCS